MKKVFALSSLLLAQGCMLVDCGYTEDEPLERYSVAETEKYSITYSISCGMNIPDINEPTPGLPTERSIREKIEEELKKCGLFSEVKYSEKQDETYHIAFNFRLGGVTKEEYNGASLISGLTLFCFPSWVDAGADLKAELYLKGERIESTAHAEKCMYITCWYALPVGLFLNYWSVWGSIENKLVDAVVNDIARTHIERFVAPDKIRP